MVLTQVEIIYGIEVPLLDSAKFLKKFPNIVDENIQELYEIEEENDNHPKNIFSCLEFAIIDDDENEDYSFVHRSRDHDRTKANKSIYVGIRIEFKGSDLHYNPISRSFNRQKKDDNATYDEIDVHDYLYYNTKIMKIADEKMTDEFKEKLEEIIDETLTDHKDYKRMIHVIPTDCPCCT